MEVCCTTHRSRVACNAEIASYDAQCATPLGGATERNLWVKHLTHRLEYNRLLDPDCRGRGKKQPQRVQQTDKATSQTHSQLLCDQVVPGLNSRSCGQSKC